MDQVIVIPTLDPSGSLIPLVGALQDRGFSRFLIVDDGSAERYQSVFERLRQRGCAVLHHDANRGKGAAIRTALANLPALFPGAPSFITVDGDGQHLPDDVLRVALRSQEHPDALVLGQRNLRSRMVPRRSRLGNRFSALYFKADTGFTCDDTQTGLRCIPTALYALARSTPGDRYDYEMNFLTRVVRDGHEVEMVDIATVYEGSNEGSHFRAVADSYLIYRTPIRFALSSLASAAVDLGLFALICALIQTDVYALVAAATLTARVASGGFNFILNRHWSFEATGEVPRQAGRYALLFVAQMLASAGGVAALAFLPLPLVVDKMLVDSALFVVSFFIQRNWVFVDRDHDRSHPRSVKVYG